MLSLLCSVDYVTLVVNLSMDVSFPLFAPSTMVVAGACTSVVGEPTALGLPREVSMPGAVDVEVVRAKRKRGEVTTAMDVSSPSVCGELCARAPWPR